MRNAGLALVVLMAPALVSVVSGAARRPAGPDVFVGYSYTHAGEADLHGWEASGSYPLGTSLRIVADLAGHYGSFAQAELTQATFMAGARWTWAKARFRPFVEGLLGGVRTKTAVPDLSVSDSDIDWGGALGGGVDYLVKGRWAARAQAALLLLRAEGAWESDPRLSLGIVYRLGQ
jgi:hypothetical protein